MPQTVQQHSSSHWQRSSRRKSPTTCPLVSPSRNRGWGQLCGGAGKFKATTLGPPCLSTQAGGREFGALGWDGVALPSSSVPGLPHGPRPSAGRSVIPCNRHISAVKQSFIDRKKPPPPRWGRMIIKILGAQSSKESSLRGQVSTILVGLDSDNLTIT